MIPYDSPRKLAFMLSTWPRTTMVVPRGSVFFASATIVVDRVGHRPEVRPLHVRLDVEGGEHVVVGDVHRR